MSGQIPQFDNEAEWDSWIEERTDVDDCDSTDEEDMELLCKRFKTWHDDAWVSVLVWMRLDAGFVALPSALLMPLFRLFVTRSILPDVVSIFISFIMFVRGRAAECKYSKQFTVLLERSASVP